jgi:uncharacterized membrane protein
LSLRASIAALAVVGGGIAAYLTWAHYAHTAPVCTNSGCETVQHSSYAELVGVPVALLGLISYAVLLGVAALRGPAAALAGAFIALTGTAFSGYLLWAQLARIHAICVWCVGNDVVIATIAVLCALRLVRED